MKERAIHQCQCAVCQGEAKHLEKALHQQVNLLMSRLDEQERRWYAGLEARRLGHGGIDQVAKMTGLDEKTIARGMAELAEGLEGRPQKGVRLAGAGRPRTEKKSQK